MQQVLIKHEVERSKDGMVVGIVRTRHNHTVQSVEAVIDNGQKVRTTSGDVWDVKRVSGQKHDFETVAMRYN